MKKILVIVGWVLLCFSQSSHAVNIWCSGKVNAAYVASNGELMISGDWAPNWTQVCSVKTAWKGVATEVCNSWFAISEAAVIARSPVTLMYSSDVDSCGNLPTYGGTPAPAYLMLKSE